MKITIDTKEDSAEEIKKIIGFLNSVVGKGAVSNADFFEQKEIPPENVLGTIFDVGNKGIPKEKPEKAKKVETDNQSKDSKIQIIY